MSCYFRHIESILSEVGIEVTPGNRKRIDRAIHDIVRVTYKDCPAAWKTIKTIIGDDRKRQEFLQTLRQMIG
ncbi:MAG: hypothetical protein A2Y91_01090 [Chloroflexi bacterium RBG_13_54_8]|nr:MAG: hypothetical protein A2Y91_01090 [Chloroflexi bacterium RBG_13_54_8]